MSVSPRAVSLLLTLTLGVLADGPAVAQTHKSKLDRVLRDAARSGSHAPQRVIVQTRPGTRAALKRAFQSHGDLVEADHPSLDALTVTVHQEDLAALEADPSVLAVSIDADVTSFGRKKDPNSGKSSREDREDDTRYARDGNDRDGNDRDGNNRDGYARDRNARDRNARDTYQVLNTLRGSLGLDAARFRGEGVSVAILDSGVAPNRDLAARIAGFWDFTRGGIPTRPFDDYGHGTHVAGLIASAGTESNNEYAGVAPGVRIYGLKVLDKFGRGRASDVVRALEWIVANKRSSAPGAVKIDIVNLSLGHPIYEPAATDPLVRAVENAVRAGVTVVAAAGNNGQGENGLAGYAGVTSPGNAPSAITVGAVNTKNTADRRDDRMAVFSSRGPTWLDGFAKPEIVAPGVGLASDAADDCELYSEYPELRLSGRYRKLARLSGTSMAAATATGVAALALEASRIANHGDALSPKTLKAVLQYTAIAVRQPSGELFEPLAQGAGQVNGSGAIALALAINTHIGPGQSWLRDHVRPASVIHGDLLQWTRTLVWHDSLIRGSDVLSIHSQLWNDNIVWGTGCDTDDAQCVTAVWGSVSEVNNIVWGTGLEWADRLVFGNRVIGLFLGQDNIVWGTLAGLTEDNIVWGTFLDADNIVWGTFLGGDNIVWGTLRGDNIVWGTLDGRPEGGRQ